MAFTAQQVIQLRAPQWAADPRINNLIALAQQGISAEVCGDRYGEAIGLKVLHQLAVEYANGGNPGTGTNTGTGSIGKVASESEGDLSRSFNYTQTGSMATIDDLTSTIYGQELLKLLRSCSMYARTRRMT